MNTEAFVALVGSVVLAVLVRVSNMVCVWLSRVLGVTPPDPILPPGEQHRPLGEDLSPDAQPPQQ